MQLGAKITTVILMASASIIHAAEFKEEIEAIYRDLPLDIDLSAGDSE